MSTEYIVCPECGGEGRIDCEYCDDGFIECELCDRQGPNPECPECYGDGAIDCDECDSMGWLQCPKCQGNLEVPA